MIRLLPRSTPLYSSAASDVYKRQPWWRAGPFGRGKVVRSVLGFGFVLRPGVAELKPVRPGHRSRGQGDQPGRLRGEDQSVGEAGRGPLRQAEFTDRVPHALATHLL